MPVIIESMSQLVEHVQAFFPFDDMPEIFGLDKSATEKATSD